jgi:hypothetical protein
MLCSSAMKRASPASLNSSARAALRSHQTWLLGTRTEIL